MKKIFNLFLLFFLLSCSTVKEEDKFSFAFDEEDKGKKVIFSVVPDTGGIIANAMAVGFAKVSETNHSEGIKELLAAPIVIAVTGKSPSINVATLERALKDFQGQGRAIVYIKASPQQIDNLQKIASPKGVKIKNGNRL